MAHVRCMLCGSALVELNQVQLGYLTRLRKGVGYWLGWVLVNLQLLDISSQLDQFATSSHPYPDAQGLDLQNEGGAEFRPIFKFGTGSGSTSWIGLNFGSGPVTSSIWVRSR